jgi:hypothetical protein
MTAGVLVGGCSSVLIPYWSSSVFASEGDA